MTFGRPLAPIAEAEARLRAGLAVQLVANGKITHRDADANAAIWQAIVAWASARDGETWQAPQCGWRAAANEATRVAAAAVKSFAAGEPAIEDRAMGLCKLAGCLATAADVWTAPPGAIPGEEFTQAYLAALQAASPVQMAAAA